MKSLAENEIINSELLSKYEICFKTQFIVKVVMINEVLNKSLN